MCHRLHTFNHLVTEGAPPPNTHTTHAHTHTPRDANGFHFFKCFLVCFSNAGVADWDPFPEETSPRAVEDGGWAAFPDPPAPEATEDESTASPFALHQKAMIAAEESGGWAAPKTNGASERWAFEATSAEVRGCLPACGARRVGSPNP
jgi:hypothetical protein